MRIAVTRMDARRYSTTVERDDGVTLSVPAYGFMRALPHDLAHYAVEAALGLRRGFWGSIAEGARFRGMELIEGRQKPRAAEASKAIADANVDPLNEADRLVACVETIVTGGLDRDRRRVEAELKEATASFRPPVQPIEPAAATAACAAWRAMQARWDALPVGGRIEVAWPPAARRARGARPR